MNETEETADLMTFNNDDSSCKYFLYRTIGSSDQQLVESGFKVHFKKAITHVGGEHRVSDMPGMLVRKK